mmetsp:Transcript_39217/g.104103  ORF Transcript_39217/g.104103 Transcript_39217/m.104103 type:complete len:100 (-) Transcript_39217:212-511(-)
MPVGYELTSDPDRLPRISRRQLPRSGSKKSKVSRFGQVHLWAIHVGASHIQSYVRAHIARACRILHEEDSRFFSSLMFVASRSRVGCAGSVEHTFAASR